MNNSIKSLDFLFKPDSIAVVGASSFPIKWGFIVPANIIAGDYTGKLYLVNPKGGKILNYNVYKSLNEIPDKIDLVIVTSPANTVPAILMDCAKKKVKVVLIISSGFSESGNEGKKLESEIVEFARKNNILIAGPNTMGVFSATKSLRALMPPVQPPTGNISFVAQSGNVGTQLLGLGELYGIGFNKFICSGTEADIQTEDYIEYFGNDDSTDVILAYIEGLDFGRKFINVAKKISNKKPIIVYKGGRTKAGSSAAASHSGQLAGSIEIYNSVFKQCGIINASSTDELLDLAKGFAYLTLPKINNVGIITWGGGWGVITADACEEENLQVAKLPNYLINEIDKLLPYYWSKGNPIDLVGTLDRIKHLQILEHLVACPEIGAVIALGIVGASFIRNIHNYIDKLHIPSSIDVNAFGREFASIEEKFMKRIQELQIKYKKPIVCVMISPSLELQNKAKEGIVIYQTPERAAKILAKLFEYQRFIYGQN